MGRKQKRAQPPARYEPRWLDRLDGRIELAREMKMRREALMRDLGGMDSLSTSKRILIDRSLFLLHAIESMERDLIEGRDVEIGKWGYAVNSLAGLLTKLGMDKVRQEKSLDELIAETRSASE